MIEPTDEMVQLVYERIDFVNHGDVGIREGLAAVLAIVERDYMVGPKGAAADPFEIVVRERCEECDDFIDWHGCKGCQGDFGHCPCSVRVTS